MFLFYPQFDEWLDKILTCQHARLTKGGDKTFIVIIDHI